MPAAIEATTAQKIRILRLSDQVDILNPDPDAAKDPGPVKIGSDLIESVRGTLGQQKVSTVHTESCEGIGKGRTELEKAGGKADTAKVIHVVSDLRAIDWQEDGEAISQIIREMNEVGIKIHLVDVSTPSRPTDPSKPLAFSDNVGIVEFKPRTRTSPPPMNQSISRCGSRTSAPPISRTCRFTSI